MCVHVSECVHVNECVHVCAAPGCALGSFLLVLGEQTLGLPHTCAFADLVLHR